MSQCLSITFGLEWTVAHGDRKDSVTEKEQPVIKMQEIILRHFHDWLLLNTHPTCRKCFVLTFRWLQQVAQVLTLCCFCKWYSVSVNECQTGCAESVAMS